VLRCDLTLHRWPVMGSPSGRGPRDSAHASGGCPVAYSTMPRYRYQITAQRQRFGALPRAVASCVVGGDRQRCLVAILQAAAKRGASKAAWLSEPETAAMGAAEDPSQGPKPRTQAKDPRPLPRSRPQRQRQLRALDQTPGAGLPTHPTAVMDQLLMLMKRLPW
jgi:hypothetical protein